MNKKDCKIGMFVAVIQNTSSLSRNRAKVKRIGRVVGIYSNYVNLLLFDSDLSNIYETGKITIKRKLYYETFRFSEVFKIEGKILDERW